MAAGMGGEGEKKGEGKQGAAQHDLSFQRLVERESRLSGIWSSSPRFSGDVQVEGERKAHHNQCDTSPWAICTRPGDVRTALDLMAAADYRHGWSARAISVAMMRKDHSRLCPVEASAAHMVGPMHGDHARPRAAPLAKMRRAE